MARELLNRLRRRAVHRDVRAEGVTKDVRSDGRTFRERDPAVAPALVPTMPRHDDLRRGL
jgi:hypothetical protein